VDRGGLAGRVAGDDAIRGDDEVDRDVVAGHRDGARRAELQFVHGRDADGVRADQAGRGGQGVLEVGEAAALAEPGAVRAGRDAAHDHEVDGGQLGQGNPAGIAGRAGDRGGLARGSGQVVRIEREERLGLGEAGDRHVDGLAVLQRALADRELGGVGVGLERQRGLPLRQGAEALGGRFRAGEVRDAAGRAREAGHLRGAHGIPYVVADRGLGGKDIGGTAGIMIMTGRGSCHGAHLAAENRSSSRAAGRSRVVR
jgi:hypothetical protein